MCYINRNFLANAENDGQYKYIWQKNEHHCLKQVSLLQGHVDTFIAWLGRCLRVFLNAQRRPYSRRPIWARGHYRNKHPVAHRNIGVTLQLLVEAVTFWYILPDAAAEIVHLAFPRAWTLLSPLSHNYSNVVSGIQNLVSENSNENNTCFLNKFSCFLTFHVLPHTGTVAMEFTASALRVLYVNYPGTITSPASLAA